MSEILMWIGNFLISLGIVLFAAAFFFWLFLRRLNVKLDAKIQEISKELEDKFIPLNIELDNGTYFCYNARDNSFVCQGQTALEIREAFQNRFPNCVAFLNNDEAVPELKKEFLELKLGEAGDSK